MGQIERDSRTEGPRPGCIICTCPEVYDDYCGNLAIDDTAYLFVQSKPNNCTSLRIVSRSYLLAERLYGYSTMWNYAKYILGITQGILI